MHQYLSRIHRRVCRSCEQYIYFVIDLCDYLLIRLIVRKREGKLKFPRNSKRKEWKRMVDKFELLKNSVYAIS